MISREAEAFIHMLSILHACCLLLYVSVLQAIHTAADLAKIHKSKVIVLVVDHPGQQGDPAVKMQVINK